MLSVRVLRPAIVKAFKSKPRKAVPVKMPSSKSSAAASKKTMKEKKTQ
jgi:hypothetical protein